MRVPREDLYDFIVVEPKPPEPPAVARLRLSGKIEVLTPLAGWKGLNARHSTGEPPDTYWLPWFHRSLVFGGAFAVIVFILGTGLYIWIYGPPVDPSNFDVAVVDPAGIETNQPNDEIASLADESTTDDLLPSENSPSGFANLDLAPLTARRRYSRSRVYRAAHRPRRRLPQPQLVVSEFVPTRLFIYVEDGEVKSRIEPQLTASYKRPVAIPN